MRLWRAFGLIVVVSLPTLTVGDECITLESFASSREGRFPEGWFSHAEAGRLVYRVHVEPGGRFVRASAKGVGILGHLHRTWSLEEYPVLAWKWRPREFPIGADERERGRNDSVLGVYVAFSSPWGAVKYVWSEKLAKGVKFETGFLGRTKVVVLESGIPPDRSVWVEVRANVAVDYQKGFKRTTLAAPVGLSILTDSDDTHTYAEGDYAEFSACRR